jgi:hypothetical protein
MDAPLAGLDQGDISPRGMLPGFPDPRPLLSAASAAAAAPWAPQPPDAPPTSVPGAHLLHPKQPAAALGDDVHFRAFMEVMTRPFPCW